VGESKDRRVANTERRIHFTGTAGTRALVGFLGTAGPRSARLFPGRGRGPCTSESRRESNDQRRDRRSRRVRGVGPGKSGGGRGGVPGHRGSAQARGVGARRAAEDRPVRRGSSQRPGLPASSSPGATTPARGPFTCSAWWEGGRAPRARAPGPGAGDRVRSPEPRSVDALGPPPSSSPGALELRRLTREAEEELCRESRLLLGEFRLYLLPGCQGTTNYPDSLLRTHVRALTDFAAVASGQSLWCLIWLVRSLCAGGEGSSRPG
jgi:hypothetical protein